VLIGRHGSPGWSDILAKLKGTVDLVVDNVGGAAFPDMLELLKTGGTLITSGAIAGPVVDLDLRTLYLRDLRLLGTTRWADEVLSTVCCLLPAAFLLLSAACCLLPAVSTCILASLALWHRLLC
jgi:NADPH:quinone reductase-like Zn-dependent oxidoreductase